MLISPASHRLPTTQETETKVGDKPLAQRPGGLAAPQVPPTRPVLAARAAQIWPGDLPPTQGPFPHSEGAADTRAGSSAGKAIIK